MIGPALTRSQKFGRGRAWAEGWSVCRVRGWNDRCDGWGQWRFVWSPTAPFKIFEGLLLGLLLKLDPGQRMIVTVPFTDDLLDAFKECFVDGIVLTQAVLARVDGVKEDPWSRQLIKFGGAVRQAETAEAVLLIGCPIFGCWWRKDVSVCKVAVQEPCFTIVTARRALDHDLGPNNWIWC